MITISNPSMGAKGLSVKTSCEPILASTDIRKGISRIELPVQPCELSLVSLTVRALDNPSLSPYKVAMRRPATLPDSRYLRYSIWAYDKNNKALYLQSCTYPIGELTTQTSPMHTIIAPKGTTKLAVVARSGFNLAVRVNSEVSFYESTN